MAIDTLYFGTATPSGSVSADDWRRFIDTEATPRFRDGLSFWPVTGQWESGIGTLVREESYALMLVHPESTAAEAEVASIINAYKTRFRQESVLRLSGRSCVSF